MKVFVASDHAGFDLKIKVVDFLKAKNINYSDLGPSTQDRVDYPQYSKALCEILKPLPSSQDVSEFGILICGSGQGMAMSANKYSHIRAALCWDLSSSKLSREHNNANVLCLGSRLIPHTYALEILDIFLNTSFQKGRHSERLGQFCK